MCSGCVLWLVLYLCVAVGSVGISAALAQHVFMWAAVVVVGVVRWLLVVFSNALAFHSCRCFVRTSGQKNEQRMGN